MIAPIVTLMYCFRNFDFDRGVLEVNTAMLPAGSFERQARMLANPSELFLFRNSFDSLRIMSATDMVIRLGINLTFCNRMKRVIKIQIARQKRAVQQQHQWKRTISMTIRQQKRASRFGALPFVLSGYLVLTATNKSKAISTAACAEYRQCVMYAQRWNTGDVCLYSVLIDMHKEPKTCSDWVDPISDTQIVRQLAKSGDLQVLQPINRRLQELPDELQRCTNMRHMSVLKHHM